MSAGGISTEANAVEAAFVQRVQILYQSLATNLGDLPNSERKVVEAFMTGLNIARRARELALKAIGVTPMAASVETATVARVAVKPRAPKRARKSRA